MIIPNITNVGQQQIPKLCHTDIVLSFTTGCFMLYLCTADNNLFESRSFENFALCTPI